MHVTRVTYVLVTYPLTCTSVPKQSSDEAANSPSEPCEPRAEFRTMLLGTGRCVWRGTPGKGGAGVGSSGVGTHEPREDVFTYEATGSNR